MNQDTSALNEARFDVGSAFYDAILAVSVDETEELSDTELDLYDSISSMMEESKDLSQFVPVLPKPMILFLEELKKENTDFDKICNIVKQDIALVGETIRVANSPLYRRFSGQIDSIERAISCIGLQGVTKIASMLLVKQILDVDSPRFKLFGQVLWNHSIECAEACRILSSDDEDPFTCYLMGLIHDAGKVAIFTCVSNYLNAHKPDNVDETKIFKMVLSENSTWLSAHIAEQWELPVAIVVALREFDIMTLTSYLDYDTAGKSSLAVLLEKANGCSEIYTLISTGVIKTETGVELLRGLGLDRMSISSILDRYELLNLGTDLVSKLHSD